MHEPESRSSSDHAAPTRKHLNPWLAAAILGTLILAVFAYAQLAKDSRSAVRVAAVGSGGEEGSELQNARATLLAEFSLLEEARFGAYENAAIRYLDDFLTPDSPLRPIIQREIRHMKREDLRAEIRHHSRSLEIEQLSRERAVLLQVLERDVKIIDSAGKDVSERDKPVVSVISWVLRATESGWRIHNSKTLEPRDG